MKIIINENEVYEINFDEEVSPRQFQELLIRLNTINKLIGRDPLLSQLIIKPDVKLEKRKYTSIGAKRPWSKDRDEAIHLIKLHYLGEGTDKLKYAEKAGLCWDDIVKSFHGMRRKWNVTAEEIGIPFFPQKTLLGQTIFDLRNIIDREGLKYTPDKNREIINQNENQNENKN